MASVSLWLGLVAVVALVVGCILFLSSERFDPRVPEVAFVDVTERSGIRFTHNNGAAGDDLLPESMGSGVAVLDFDGDGDQDLFFVNSTYWPWELREGLEATTAALYRNRGDGVFEDVAAEFGLDVSLFGMGVAVGDYDNDGWVDLYVSAVGEDRLFRNVEGTGFVDVTAEAGVAGAENEWSASAAWVDLDNDGLLDLFVCNYVRWARELGIETAFKLAGLGHGYGGPQVNFTGTVPYLYLNNGDGTFREMARERGLELVDELTGYPKSRSLAVAPIDIDEDGWLDLVVANHEMENHVFRNLGDARFEELGANYAEASGGSAGIDAARVGREGLLGVAVGSFANELGQAYPDSGDSLLFGEGGGNGGGSALQRFGMFFFDYDLDGRLDILAVNGYLEKEINRIDTDVEFRRSAQLFWNAGNRFEQRFLVAEERQAGSDLFRPVIGRGAAFADFDGTGSLDVVITQNGGAPVLLRNKGVVDRSWIRIRLVGTKVNRDAIGAQVEVRVGHRTLLGRVMPTRSYLSQSELPLTFGLGRAWRVREVIVLWPDGSRESFGALPIGEESVLVQGQGEAS